MTRASRLDFFSIATHLQNPRLLAGQLGAEMRRDAGEKPLVVGVVGVVVAPLQFQRGFVAGSRLPALRVVCFR
jgi:hypothetical protein